HGLGRRAARVDAGADQLAALSQEDLLAGTREPRSQRDSRLAASDDDDVDLHAAPPCTSRPLIRRRCGSPPARRAYPAERSSARCRSEERRVGKEGRSRWTAAQSEQAT